MTKQEAEALNETRFLEWAEERITWRRTIVLTPKEIVSEQEAEDA